MIFGPDSISLCPRCFQPIRIASFVSTNDFDALRWTDGAITGVPTFPILVVCPHCVKPVWRRELEAGKNPTKMALGALCHVDPSIPLADGFGLESLQEGLEMAATDQDKVLAVRRLAWQRSNDPYRMNAVRPVFRDDLRDLRIPFASDRWRIWIRLISGRVPSLQRQLAMKAIRQVIGSTKGITITDQAISRLVASARDGATLESVVFGLFSDLADLQSHHQDARALATADNLTALAGMHDQPCSEKAEALRELSRFDEAIRTLSEINSGDQRLREQIKCLSQKQISTVQSTW